MGALEPARRPPPPARRPPPPVTYLAASGTCGPGSPAAASHLLAGGGGSASLLRSPHGARSSAVTGRSRPSGRPLSLASFARRGAGGPFASRRACAGVGASRRGRARGAGCEGGSQPCTRCARHPGVCPSRCRLPTAERVLTLDARAPGVFPGCKQYPGPSARFTFLVRPILDGQGSVLFLRVVAFQLGSSLC